jgi:hypothetical protein
MELRKKHFIEYSLFLAASVLFLVLFIAFRTDRNTLKLISGLIFSVYVLWGTIHSALEERLTPIIVFEYVLFGFLAFLLLFIALSFKHENSLVILTITRQNIEGCRGSF